MRRLILHPLASLLVPLLSAGCLGGQTGQPTRERPGLCARVEEPDASAVLARYDGSYRGLVFAGSGEAAADSGVSCPPGEYRTITATVAGTADPALVAEKLCGASYVPVRVELADDDGTELENFEGWLSEDGSIHWDGGWITLDSASKRMSLEGPASLRSVDECCIEPPPDALSELDLLGSTELLAFTIWNPETAQEQRVELSLSLSAALPVNNCGELTASFRLEGAQGDEAAAGTGALRYQQAACTRAETPCFDFEFTASGAVVSTAELVGEGYPDQLVAVDLVATGHVGDDGELEAQRVSIEAGGAVLAGIVLSTEQTR